MGGMGSDEVKQAVPNKAAEAVILKLRSESALGFPTVQLALITQGYSQVCTLSLLQVLFVNLPVRSI